ncbi:TPA: Ger(x)C family spore germination protein [Bacillus pseudomycoides]|nr:Ger(x)C family spore germination protein [Bacillus pseudomycoides]
MNKVVILAIVVIVLCGCVRMKEVDKLDIIQVLGFDKNGDKLTGTALYPEYNQNRQENKAGFLRAEASTVNLILSRMNRKAASPVEIGKLKVLMFGESIAKKGISDLVRAICRDPLIGSNLQIVVAEKSAEKLLKEAKKEGALYLFELIKQNIQKESSPLTNVQMFLFNYYGEGRDAYLPYLKVNKDHSIAIDGIGIMKGEKLKLHLNENEMFTFKLLSGHGMNGNIEMPIKKENKAGYIVYNNLYGTVKMKASGLDVKPKVTVNITMSGLIKDSPSWLDLKNTHNIKFLTKKIEIKQTKEVYRLIKKLQKYEVDPIGIGDFIRGRQRNWNEKEFYKIYPLVTFKVETQLKLLQSGVGE